MRRRIAGKRLGSSIRVVPGDTCPRRFVPLIETNSFKGPEGEKGESGQDGSQGPQGEPGTDGQDAAWGDGSAGARVISADETLSDDNLQYSDFTVEAGQTLTVPSGTIIRCTGTFTNNGIIAVSGAGTVGVNRQDFNIFLGPTQGIAEVAATGPQTGTDATLLGGGIRGKPISAESARNVLRPPLIAGGSGSNGLLGSLPPFGSGGGGVAIYCKGGVNNIGTIEAFGVGGLHCNGGGAGGIVILATAGALNNSGTIQASGGNGGLPIASCGGGGGGGGGIIHILAQSVTNTGTTEVSGGAGASDSIDGTVTNGTRSGGGGGGACAGEGGNGANVTTLGRSENASDGSPGLVIIRSGFNPAGMLN